MVWASSAGQRRWPELKRLFAIPNGGHRSKVTATRLKMEGVRRGVPDLMLPVMRGGYGGLWIEMKTSKGRASPDQRDWLAYLSEAGYRAEVCHGTEAAIAVLEDYLGSGA